MVADEPRGSFSCFLEAALPIIAPFVTLGIMLSLLAVV
jgi:hypothetical protein